MKRIAFYIAQRPPPGALFVHGYSCGKKSDYYGGTSDSDRATKESGVNYTCDSLNSDDSPHNQHMAESTTHSSGGHENPADEYKDDMEEEEEDESILAPIEDMDQWVYVEDISLDYAFAQSVLFKIAGGAIQETGHKTKGHVCVTDGDKANSKRPGARGSLLYGELLPRGANKAFGRSHLSCEGARVLFDLGMGTGKIAIQAFLQYRNLEYVYGVELSEGRFNVADEYVTRMVELLGSELYTIERHASGRRVTVTEVAVRGGRGRVLVFECGDMFTVRNLAEADIVMMETDIPMALHHKLCLLLNEMKVGARTLSYLDLRKVWPFEPFTFRQLSSNRHVSDRFPTSWSVQRGHHFFLWVKISEAKLKPSLMFDPVGVQSDIEVSSSRSGSHFSGNLPDSNTQGRGDRRGRGGRYDGVDARGDSFVSRCSPYSLFRTLSSLFRVSGRSNIRRGKKVGNNVDPRARSGLGVDPLDKVCPLEATQGRDCANGTIGSATKKACWRSCDEDVSGDENDIDDDLENEEQEQEHEQEEEEEEEEYSPHSRQSSSESAIQALRGPLGNGILSSSAIERECMTTPPASPVRSFVLPKGAVDAIGRKNGSVCVVCKYDSNQQKLRQRPTAWDEEGHGSSQGVTTGELNVLDANTSSSDSQTETTRSSQLNDGVSAGMNLLIENVTARVVDLRVRSNDARDAGRDRGSTPAPNASLGTDNKLGEALGCSVSPINRLLGDPDGFDEASDLGHPASFVEVGFNTHRIREVLLEEERDGYVRNFTPTG